MKKRTLILLAIGFLGTATIVACGDGENKQETPTEVATEQYQCPMKCTEEIFDKPDTCKVCGMDLEKITKG